MIGGQFAAVAVRAAFPSMERAALALILPLYGAVRTSVEALHDLAPGIDADIGLRQIYGEPDSIHRALERTRALATTIQLLESQLFACASPATNARAACSEI